MSLNKILSDVFGMSQDQFLDETNIMSLPNFDSMNHMMFITELEGAFSIELTGDEIAEMVTIGEIKRILHVKGVLL